MGQANGKKKVPGSPIIYGTTDFFLEYFGLEQVTDLPGLEELKAAGLLESRLPTNLSIAEPKNVDHSEIEPFGDDENIDDLISSEIKAVSYSDNLKSVIKEIYEKYKVTSHQKMKSSLKFCVVAAGEFDLYAAEPREIGRAHV